MSTIKNKTYACIGKVQIKNTYVNKKIVCENYFFLWSRLFNILEKQENYKGKL